MKLQSHYYNDAKFDCKKNKKAFNKICKCPVTTASYIIVKPTSERLNSIGFIDGHGKDDTAFRVSKTLRNFLYFN